MISLQAQVEVIGTSDLGQRRRDEIIAVCDEAFNLPFGALFDYVANSIHVLARIDGKLVGHACWAARQLEPGGVRPLRTAYVDAVATHPGYQGRGIGRLVMARLAHEIEGYELGGLSTDVPLFYEKLGWERWRGPTAMRIPEGLKNTTGETVMVLRLPNTPPLNVMTSLVAEWRSGQPW